MKKIESTAVSNKLSQQRLSLTDAGLPRTLLQDGGEASPSPSPEVSAVVSPSPSINQEGANATVVSGIGTAADLATVSASPAPSLVD